MVLNGESEGFERVILDNVGPVVYPKFEALDISPLLKVRAQLLRVLRFEADAHIGGLAKLLRISGFDTLYDDGFEDGEIAEIAAQQGRIVLTRDRELLKRRIISHGCYVHALKPSLQLRELYERLDRARSARPFSLAFMQPAAARNQPGTSPAPGDRCRHALAPLFALPALRRLPTGLLGGFALTRYVSIAGTSAKSIASRIEPTALPGINPVQSS